MTFRDPKVLEALCRLLPVKLDIDAQEDQAACKRYRRSNGVPEFVLLAGNGSVLRRWDGARDAAQILPELQPLAEQPPPSEAKGLERLREVAEFYLRRGDFGRADATLEDIRRVDPDDIAGLQAELMWQRCDVLREAGRWPELRPTLETYLSRHGAGIGAARKQAARVLLGRARVETGGEATPELRQRIVDLIEDLASPFPKPGLADRLRARVLGSTSTAHQERATAWVHLVNRASDSLEQIGRPAVADLRQAMKSKDRSAADRAGRALAVMRLPETTDFLLAELRQSKPGQAYRGP